jgi:cytoskeletal protein RodZ
VPDSAGRVSVPSADTQAVSPAFTISPPPNLDSGAVTTTVAAGQNLYVQVTVGSSDDAQVSVNQSGVDMLASQGVFPTENSSTEQASGSPGPASLDLPDSSPGVWYIDLHGEDVAGAPPGESVTVSVASDAFPQSLLYKGPTSGPTRPSPW